MSLPSIRRDTSAAFVANVYVSLHLRPLYTPPPTPFTLHPTPYTLHPLPYTLHPTPYPRTRVSPPHTRT